MKFFLNSLIFVVVLTLNKAYDFDYRYQSKWYDVNDQCSFNRQSPIEISSAESLATTRIPALHFTNYNLLFTKPIQLSNNGHTVNIELPKPDGYVASLWKMYDRISPSISGALLLDGRFVTESVHFHWGSKDTHGSEHVIDNQRYSMEMHVLHRNAKYQTVEEARQYEDGLAVLAIFYHVKTTQLNGFKGLENIIASMATIKNFNHSAQVGNFTLSELFGNMSTAEFYTYQGSLTTPPCSQAVQWIVFPQVINISHAQMQRFRSLSDNHGEILENNYRHLQPKGTRLVFYRQQRNVLDGIFSSPNIWSVLDKLKPQPFQSGKLINALKIHHNDNNDADAYADAVDVASVEGK